MVELFLRESKKVKANLFFINKESYLKKEGNKEERGRERDFERFFESFLREKVTLKGRK